MPWKAYGMRWYISIAVIRKKDQGDLCRVLWALEFSDHSSWGHVTKLRAHNGKKKKKSEILIPVTHLIQLDNPLQFCTYRFDKWGPNEEVQFHAKTKQNKQKHLQPSSSTLLPCKTKNISWSHIYGSLSIIFWTILFFLFGSSLNVQSWVC